MIAKSIVVIGGYQSWRERISENVTETRKKKLNIKWPYIGIGNEKNRVTFNYAIFFRRVTVENVPMEFKNNAAVKR